MNTFQFKNFMGTQRSALEIIVRHEVPAFARHPFFNEMIEEKWTKFACWMYVRGTVVPYVFLLAVFTAFVTLRAEELHVDLGGGGSGGTGGTGDTSGKPSYCVQDADAWAWNGTDYPVSNGTDYSGGFAAGQLRIASFILHLAITFVFCPFLVRKGWQSRRLKLRDLDTDENGNVSYPEALSFIYKNAHFFLSLGAATALCASFVARLKCKDHTEIDAAAVASVLLFANLLIILMPFRFIGELVITIYRMFVGDIFRFLLVFGVLQLGFSLSILLLTRSAADPSRYYGDSLGITFLHLLWLSLGDGLSENVSDLSGMQSGELVLATYIIWVVLSEVLLLNLLISMMSRTFDGDSEDVHRIWIFPFAALVLRIERQHPGRSCGPGCGMRTCVPLAAEGASKTSVDSGSPAARMQRSHGHGSRHVKKLQRRGSSKMMILHDE